VGGGHVEARAGAGRKRWPGRRPLCMVCTSRGRFSQYFLRHPRGFSATTSTSRNAEEVQVVVIARILRPGARGGCSGRVWRGGALLRAAVHVRCAFNQRSAQPDLLERQSIGGRGRLRICRRTPRGGQRMGDGRLGAPGGFWVVLKRKPTRLRSTWCDREAPLEPPLVGARDRDPWSMVLARWSEARAGVPNAAPPRCPTA